MSDWKNPSDDNDMVLQLENLATDNGCALVTFA